MPSLLPCRLCTEIRRDQTDSISSLAIKKDCLESIGTWLLSGFRSICGRTIIVTRQNQLKQLQESTTSKICTLILLIIFAPIIIIAGVIGFTALLLSCSHRKQFQRIKEALKFQLKTKPAPTPVIRVPIPAISSEQNALPPLTPPLTTTPSTLLAEPPQAPTVPVASIIPDAVEVDPKRWVPNISPRYLEKIKPVLTVEENEKDPILFNLSASAVKREGKSGYAVTMNATSQLPVDVVNSRGDFTFVLDVSGSMFHQKGDGKPIEHAQNALISFLKKLSSTDRFCIFLFDVSASLLGEGLVPATKENIEKMIDLIKQIKYRKSSTNFRTMLDESMSMLISIALANRDKEESQARAINTIILTDGKIERDEFRVDNQDFESSNKKIRSEFPKAPYRTHVIAIKGADGPLMKQMALAGNGSFFDLTEEFNSRRAKKVLNEIRQAALPVIVRKFELHLNLTGVKVTVKCIADDATPPNWKAELSQNQEIEAQNQTNLGTRKVQLIVQE